MKRFGIERFFFQLWPQLRYVLNKNPLRMEKEKLFYEAPLAELLPLRLETSILSQFDSGFGNDDEEGY